MTQNRAEGDSFGSKVLEEFVLAELFLIGAIIESTEALGQGVSDISSVLKERSRSSKHPHERRHQTGRLTNEPTALARTESGALIPAANGSSRTDELASVLRRTGHDVVEPYSVRMKHLGGLIRRDWGH
jgi:hypothetical protein